MLLLTSQAGYGMDCGTTLNFGVFVLRIPLW